MGTCEICGTKSDRLIDGVCDAIDCLIEIDAYHICDDYEASGVYRDD